MGMVINEDVASPLVNFLIIGVQKGGTSALAHFLSEHREICMASQKEVHLFDTLSQGSLYSVATLNELYAPFFLKHQGEKLRGEATPVYCYFPDMAERIYKYNPNMKMILILRDPIERAISHYWMERNRGMESLTFLSACLLEPWRLWRSRGDLSMESSSRSHSYINRGYYTRQIKRFGKYFPTQQLLILNNNDLLTEHYKTLKKIYTFLGVDDIYQISSSEKIFSGQKGSVGLPSFFIFFLKWIFRREYRLINDIKQNV